MSVPKKSDSTLLWVGVAALVGGYFLFGKSANAAAARAPIPGDDDSNTAIPITRGGSANNTSDDEEGSTADPVKNVRPLVQNSITRQDQQDAAKDDRYEKGGDEPSDDDAPASPIKPTRKAADEDELDFSIPATSSNVKVTPKKVKAPVFTPIKAGQRSEQVQQLQVKLGLPVTGIYDALTAATVKKRYKIPGITTPKQWQQIMSDKSVKPVKLIPNTTFPLKKGSRGKLVVTLQHKLKIRATGVFDPMTEATLQARYKLTQISSQAQYDNILSFKPAMSRKKAVPPPSAHPTRKLHPVKLETALKHPAIKRLKPVRRVKQGPHK